MGHVHSVMRHEPLRVDSGQWAVDRDPLAMCHAPWAWGNVAMCRATWCVNHGATATYCAPLALPQNSGRQAMDHGPLMVDRVA